MWWSVLLVAETGGSVTDKLYHIMFYSAPWAAVEPTTSVVIGTDCIGSCKSNDHMITAPLIINITQMAIGIVFIDQY